jgi:uncharacterized protein with HEPN domain
MSDDRLFLLHVEECLKRIARYTAGGEQEFRASTLIQDAVLRNLQTLAESTQRLSDSLKSRHSHIDWRGIAGFRNILVHGYLGIDIGRVWLIVERDLPDLKAIVNDFRNESSDPT